jgi:hypothetical protein
LSESKKEFCEVCSAFHGGDSRPRRKSYITDDGRCWNCASPDTDETCPVCGAEQPAWVADQGASLGSEEDAIREFAEREFVDASVAVWREIDRLSSAPEGYRGLHSSTSLRKREKAAWERYRDIVLDGVASPGKRDER